MSVQAQNSSAEPMPERPWIHRYDRTLTLKMILALKKPNGGTNVLLTLDQALDVVKKIDNLTVGIPKIIYVVGWQYDGHDSKYPAFFEVNPALKRPQDSTALDSLKWFMAAASQYHTAVSVHINLRDAYQNSPLWQTYIDHDLIQRDTNGQLIKGGIWDGDQAYFVCYTREWNAGFTQKRIDRLLNLLPLEKAGTIHIDAFHTSSCPEQGVTRKQETETQRKIFRYFRDRNIDVTSEFAGDFRLDPLVGLQPMAWWFIETPREYLARPASLYTGGVGASRNDHSKISLGGELFGTSMHGEEIIRKDPKNLPDFLHQFCLQTVPWHFLNQHRRLKVELMPRASFAYFAGDVRSRVDQNGSIVITDHGRTVRDGDEVLMPASWIPGRALIAYSASGFHAKAWELPPGWKDVQKIRVEDITLDGKASAHSIAAANGEIVLTSQPDSAQLLTPGN
jgi:Endo-alpha-N-acetylgalactosaminidase